MKEHLWFTITAILLSIGMVQTPCNALSESAVKTNAIRQAISYQAPQPERHLSKRWLPQWRYSAYRGITLNKGKSPALLWHRFSLTPQPAFFHWLMASSPEYRRISAQNVYSKKQVSQGVNAGLTDER